MLTEKKPTLKGSFDEIFPSWTWMMKNIELIYNKDYSIGDVIKEKSYGTPTDLMFLISLAEIQKDSAGKLREVIPHLLWCFYHRGTTVFELQIFSYFSY